MSDYRRIGFDHTAKITGETILYDPLLDLEQECYIVDFYGGKNSKGVVIIKEEFEEVYRKVEDVK